MHSLTHLSCSWHNALWLNAMHCGKKWWIREFVAPYIFALNPDYVAACSLRSLRSNYYYPLRTKSRYGFLFSNLGREKGLGGLNGIYLSTSHYETVTYEWRKWSDDQCGKWVVWRKIGPARRVILPRATWLGGSAFLPGQRFVSYVNDSSSFLRKGSLR